MTWFEALILGTVQGLTEFLPVSSSGHLEIGKALLNVEIKENLSFTVLVHFATVLSTITVFFREIMDLLNGLFRFMWNEPTKYVTKLFVSMIPVLLVGLFLAEEVESLFSGKLVLVGISLMVTAALLTFAFFMKSGLKKRIPFSDAFIMGIAQAIAVIPGISRSGATISTGLLLKNDREEVARFSFLMVLLPILGAALLDIMSWSEKPGAGTVPFPSLITGFLAAYISGFIACRWMITLVKKGKLIWFAVYCAIIGATAIILS
ncbi:MAG TPA: undecaprenyl-diphosphate phosphatase [Bacteroidaceae bacterium]|nr:undecaprenyl-diphosphate phosphatase [Bacteroidaceae bacterium]